MDQWRADAAPVPEPAAHLQELSFFLSVYLGKAPGVLWPEHEHPASVAARPRRISTHWPTASPT